MYTAYQYNDMAYTHQRAHTLQALPVLPPVEAPPHWPKYSATTADAPVNPLFDAGDFPQVTENASVILGPLPARAHGAPPPWLPLSPPPRPPPPLQQTRILAAAPLRRAVIAVPAAALLITAAATVIAWRWLNDYKRPWLPVCWQRRRRPRTAGSLRRQTLAGHAEHASRMCTGNTGTNSAKVLAYHESHQPRACFAS